MGKAVCASRCANSTPIESWACPEGAVSSPGGLPKLLFRPLWWFHRGGPQEINREMGKGVDFGPSFLQSQISVARRE